MFEIIITGQETGGKALMYSAIGRKGIRRMVPTYRAFVQKDGKETVFEFAVTRKCRQEVFGGARPRDYRQGHECPPNRADQPYLGRITTSGRLGFSIMLYELGCPKRETLRGVGRHLRRGIKIHFGPACSFGCMAIAGGQKGYARFVKAFRSFEAEGHKLFNVRVLERIPN